MMFLSMWHVVPSSLRKKNSSDRNHTKNIKETEACKKRFLTMTITWNNQAWTQPMLAKCSIFISPKNVRKSTIFFFMYSFPETVHGRNYKFPCSIKRCFSLFDPSKKSGDCRRILDIRIVSCKISGYYDCVCWVHLEDGLL